jgi:predicted ABC-type ATPase
MSLLLEHCRLSERDHSEIYQLIVDDLFTGNLRSARPEVVLLGGQPGSGKTKMRELAEERRKSVIINADDLRDFHPMYRDLKLSEPQKASFLVNHDVSMWTDKLIRQSVEGKRNIIFDGTFGTSDQNMLSETLNLFKNNGYESQLWVLSVPAEFSKLGIYIRNEAQIKQTGSGRFVSMKVHDLNYRNIPENIRMTLQNSLVDRVCIFSRSVELAGEKFVNNRVSLVHSFNKSEAGYSKASDIFLQMRNKPLTPELKKYFSFRFHQAVSMIDERLQIAVKNNDMDKVKSAADYKNQFLTELNFSIQSEEPVERISQKQKQNGILKKAILSVDEENDKSKGISGD